MIIAGSIIYALPNFFGNTPSLYISAKNELIESTLINEMKQVLVEKNIPCSFSYQNINENELIRVEFHNTQDQGIAYTVLEELFGEDCIITLHNISNMPKWLASLGASPMKLGLDLQGGTHLLLEADTQVTVNAYLDSNLENLVQNIKNFLDITPIEVIDTTKSANIAEALGVPKNYIDNSYVALMFANTSDLDKTIHFIESKYISHNNHLIYNHLKDKTLIMCFNNQFVAKLKKEAIDQVTHVIRNRVNALGVAESSVTSSGNSRVIVELAGLQDIVHAKKILGSTSTVSFHLVSPVQNPLQLEELGIKVYPLRLNDGQIYYYQLQKNNAVINGSEIIGSSPGIDHHTGKPIVSIQLNSNASTQFKEITSNHVGDLMGVVISEQTYKKEIIDGEEISIIQKIDKLINVATIQTALGSKFQITGLDQFEANDLALMIRSGSLQVPTYIIQEQKIGPKLGEQNIKQGKISIITALTLVVLFMAIYYKLFGIIANLALLLNLILIVAIMSIIPGTTLTLPGIAGIVLNLGMSIDSNILIFERIREELRQGASAQLAISAGYARAYTTIIDSNITTLIVAIVLFIIATGEVKGFAITLTIGIISSLFTSITVSRAITNLVYSPRFNLKKLLGI